MNFGMRIWGPAGALEFDTIFLLIRLFFLFGFFAGERRETLKLFNPQDTR